MAFSLVENWLVMDSTGPKALMVQFVVLFGVIDELVVVKC